MYESYAWPGASNYRTERKSIIKWIKQLFDGVIKKIDEKY